MSAPGHKSEHTGSNTATCFYKFLNILRNVTSWNQVLWNLVVSNVILSDSSYLRKSPYVSWFIFKIIDFWWFLLNFWCSHVRSPGGECFAPPLIRRMSAPSCRNQRVLPQVGERPLFTKFPIVKSYPNEAFSILTNMIFDADSNGVHPRSWIRTRRVEHSHISYNLSEI